MVGDLGYAGLPGRVYAPAEGKNQPAVAFAHDWMKKVKDYHATLRHLASWGIVAVAPDTETNFNPNHRDFAADLETSLQVAASVKLGQGNVVVNPSKLGLVGHGMGSSAAVLTGVDNEKVKAIAALYPAPTAPSATQAARSLKVAGLVIGPGKDDLFDAGNPAKLAYNWATEVAYREIDKGTQAGFSEDTFHKLLLGTGALQAGAMETARGLVTGFLLHQLEGEKKYAAFSEPDAAGKGVKSLTGSDLYDRAGFSRDDELSGPNRHSVARPVSENA